MEHTIRKIVIHCSDSEFGSAAEIRRWHLRRGWKDIGYHFVIGNGYPAPHFYLPPADGSIEAGRPLDGDRALSAEEIGAHAYGLNTSSVGICVVGKQRFSAAQFRSLTALCGDLLVRFGLKPEDVVGHCETEHADGKTCPNFPVAHLREALKLGDYFVR